MMLTSFDQREGGGRRQIANVGPMSGTGGGERYYGPLVMAVAGPASRHRQGRSISASWGL